MGVVGEYERGLALNISDIEGRDCLCEGSDSLDVLLECSPGETIPGIETGGGCDEYEGGKEVLCGW